MSTFIYGHKKRKGTNSNQAELKWKTLPHISSCIKEPYLKFLRIT